MELEELKEAWKAKHENVHYSRNELNSIFEIKTKRALRGINRSMWIDAILMILATAGFVAVTFILGLKSRYMISGELLFVATLLGLHYRIKYLTFNKLDLTKDGIKAAITRVIRKVKGYLLLYKILIPTFAGGLFLLYEFNLHYYNTNEFILEQPFKSVGIALIIALLALVITNFVIHIMYGKELKKLEKLIAHLSDS